MTTSAPEVRSGAHIAQFYASEEELSGQAAEFLAEALLDGGTAIVIATPRHRDAFEATLENVGADVSSAKAAQTLVLLDAQGMLESFRPGGGIEPRRFHQQVGAIMRHAADRALPVHVYGEMVALLWDADDVLGAIRLEEFWNELAGTLPFALMCGYPAVACARREHSHELQQICRLHSEVRPPRMASRQPLTSQFDATFDPGPRTPAAARRMIADALHRSGHRDQVLRDHAQLIISELATNAVIHACSPITISIDCQPDAIRLAVTDAGSQQIRGTHSTRASGLGMGLRLVSTLASDWGINQTANGRTVWAELDPAASRA